MSEKRHVHDDLQQKMELFGRLNRIEGQIRGIKKMVESEEYCEDILNQLGSVKAAINGVIMILFESHTRHCIAPAIAAKTDESIHELTRLVKRIIG